MKILTNRTYVTKTNNWFAPTCEFHEKHPSIIGMHFMDQSSSCGNWSGFFLQKTGKNTCVAIYFSQENNYPHDGFILYTGEVFCKGPVASEFHNAAEKEFYNKCM